MLRNALLALLCLLMTACYQQEKPGINDWDLTKEQMDSVTFFRTHHYGHNYNFRVTADSLKLLVIGNPMEIGHAITLHEVSVGDGDLLVVGDIFTLPSDEEDSIWVQVLRDSETMGWIHETELLENVVPNNPISRFISFFSNTHLLIILAFLVLVSGLYALRSLYRRKAKLVHFNDIGSVYPTLLTLLVASSAVFYSSIQLWAPDTWSHFYFHPTLNPFHGPVLIGIFLASVWALLIVAMASLADSRRYLTPAEMMVYYLGLMGVCAVDYVVFSVSTLYYIGYPLLLAYYVFALYRYFRYAHVRYICGNCGRRMREKGVCPWCGAQNV